MSRDPFQQCEHVEVAQATQRDPQRAALTMQPRQQLRHRIAGTHVGVAERAQHPDPHRLFRGHNLAQQLNGRPVRPMQIVENHQHRLLLRDAVRRSVTQP